MIKFASPGAGGLLSTFSVRFGFRDSTGAPPERVWQRRTVLRSSTPVQSLLKQTSNLPKVGAPHLAKSKPEATIVGR